MRDPGPLNAEVVDEVACEGYTRQFVAYDVPSGRVPAFVCIPTDLQSPAPVVFCHHQHADEFDLGKSEVCGLLQRVVREPANVGLAPKKIANQRAWARSSRWLDAPLRLGGGGG